jgi:hypothetical protein
MVQKGNQIDGYDNNKDDSSRNLTRLVILSSIVETSSGRDKTLKCIQYGTKMYIFLAKIILGSQIMKVDHLQKLASAISSLSLAR